jgi:hypothetical protein
MKRRGAEHVYSIIKDMSPAAELEYWRRRTEEMRREQERRRAQRRESPRGTSRSLACESTRR